jgi:hypothetical protein
MIDHCAQIETLPMTGCPHRIHPDQFARMIIQDLFTEPGARNCPFQPRHPGRQRTGIRNDKAFKRPFDDQVIWMINLRMDNWMPSQYKSDRAMDANNAPSRPHSSFVGSRFCCPAEIPALRAVGKSGMTFSSRNYCIPIKD